MQKIEYVVRGYLAMSEADNYEQGCHGQCHTEVMRADQWTRKAATLSELLTMLKVEFKASEQDLLLDSCDEPGRLDIQVLQRQRFQIGTPSKQTMAQFTAGKIDLWATTYSVHVERTVSEFSLADQLAAEKA